MKPTTSQQAASAAAMPIETLKRLAAIIKDGINPDDFGEISDENALDVARDVLESLRQVDDETVEAMVEAFPHYGSNADFAKAFTAAIDSILTEGGEG